MEIERWKIDPENMKHMDKDIANFIIDQAEKALKYTIEIADKTTAKALTFLLILLPTASTLIGFLVNSVKQYKNTNPGETGLLGYLLLICIISLIYLVKLFFPRDSMTLGRDPKQLIIDQILQRENCTTEEKLVYYKINEIHNYQHKIEYNRKQNNIRIALFKRILVNTGLSAILGLICYIAIVFVLAVQK